MISMKAGGLQFGFEHAAGSAPPRRPPAALGRLIASVTDLLLPPVCIACRGRIGRHGLLCGTCFAKIDFIVPPLCARLGVPLPYDTGEPSLSAAAIADPPIYDRARAVARYSETMRDLIQSLQISGSP
jgi:predicted amidophosphoribosyltransferase